MVQDFLPVLVYRLVLLVLLDHSLQQDQRDLQRLLVLKLLVHHLCLRDPVILLVLQVLAVHSVQTLQGDQVVPVLPLYPVLLVIRYPWLLQDPLRLQAQQDHSLLWLPWVPWRQRDLPILQDRLLRWARPIPAPL